ncbi:TraM recognition domain-containing protein [Paenibacillus larvae]|uniref:Conjugative coupling factor TraD, SXT/TOL subfamily n=1 Tax=Paenibacillus larvae subsp. larvae TaxID=147375 RepID=A0A6C0QZQ3_9BACL|nr:TraM recognition domain-containing protein [Paenibacillus larvae]QHZ54179.1 conjugative coupling factor TraD, SXT/TOL subfamily [Paenibacillus larvae subsp. larvae]
MAKSNEEVAQEFGFSIGIILAALVAFPIIIFSLPYLFFRRFVHKWIHGILAAVALALCIALVVVEPVVYFGLYSILPFDITWLQYFFVKPIQFSTVSVCFYLLAGLPGSFVIGVITDYIRSRQVHSIEEERLKFTASKKYEFVYKKRFVVNAEVQRKWRKKEDQGELLLGIDEAGKPYTMQFKELNQHKFVVATTGGGKTILLLSDVEYAAMKNIPVIFIDGKGSLETIDDVKAICDRYGRKLHIFSDTGKLTYNPLKYGNATTIKDKLEQLIETESKYYSEISGNLVQTMIQFIDAYKFKRDLQTFAFFLDPAEIKKVLFNDTELSTEEETDEMEDYSSFLDDEDVTNPKKSTKNRKLTARAKKFQERFFDRYKHEEDGEDYLFINASSVRTQIYLLLDSDLGHLFEEKEDGIDLIRYSDNKESLFISFDGLIYDKFLKIISRFIVLDINYLVSHRNRHKMKDQPMLAILDELSAYINDKVVDTINKSRSAGLHCVLATQTFADLQKIDASLLDQVIGNTNTHIFGQTNDPSGIEYMANTLGTYKDIDLTIQTERQEGRLDRQDLKGDKGTTRQVQKYKVAPDDIRDLRQGSFVIHRKAAGDKIQPAIIYARNPLID